jgi:hypothetical protein
MRKTSGWLRGLALAAMLLCPMWPAAAIDEGRTREGLAYVTGGITLEERETLQKSRGDYSLWLTTAYAKSGAFLSDVRVVVRGSKGQTLFDRTIVGPWLFLKLPLGRYEIEAHYGGSERKARTTIHPGDHHQVFLYFDSREPDTPDSPHRTPREDRKGLVR